MKLIILNVYLGKSILGRMLLKGPQMIRLGLKNFTKEVLNVLNHGIHQRMAKDGTVNTRRNIIISFLLKVKSALNAISHLRRKTGDKSIVQIVVNQNSEEFKNLTKLHEHVRNAVFNLRHVNSQKQSIALSIVDIKVEEKGQQRVYDIMVAGANEYFANGILVHNSIDGTRYVLQHRGTRWSV
jgi:intein/homing endonuclease